VIAASSTKLARAARPQFSVIATVFLVDDVGRAIRFYKDVLGAKLSASLPKSPLYEWASVKLEGVELMFWEKEAA
jgi:catechol 2,3-dioxygenase-like lactoylglutathione lyase family enzyme